MSVQTQYLKHNVYKKCKHSLIVMCIVLYKKKVCFLSCLHIFIFQEKKMPWKQDHSVVNIQIGSDFRRMCQHFIIMYQKYMTFIELYIKCAKHCTVFTQFCYWIHLHFIIWQRKVRSRFYLRLACWKIWNPKNYVCLFVLFTQNYCLLYFAYKFRKENFSAIYHILFNLKRFYKMKKIDTDW